MIRLLVIVILQIIFISSYNFSQRMLLDNAIENKNQLFELLGVKKQIVQYKNIQMNDSTLNSESNQILYFDTLGFVIKKEKQYSNPNNGYHSESLFIFERDSNGNIIKILEDGELKETRVCNEMSRIERWDLYKNNQLYSSGTYEYDFLGNEIQYSYINRNDTIFDVKYEYDEHNSLPLVKTSDYFDNHMETTFYKYDTTGRKIKEFTIYMNETIEDSTLYFYDYINFRDSSIEYYDGHILKTVKECDKNWRPFNITFYNEVDSLLENDIFEYDNTGIDNRDSIFTANDIEIPQKPYDEMMEEQIVSKLTVNGKISYTINTSYYPNGFLKKKIKTDFAQNRIEETTYEYEFY